MAGFTKAQQQAALDYFLKQTAWTAATTTPKFCSLFHGTATDDAAPPTGLTESTANGYARVSVAAADWNAATAGATGAASQSTNANAVTFPQASGTWGTGNVTTFGLHSASTAGTCYATGALTTSQAIGSGNTPSFAAGALVILMGDTSDTF